MEHDVAMSREISSNSKQGQSGLALHRIGQACLICRRKKVKCDGLVPCHNCSSRSLTCEYPATNDNASTSRHNNSAFEERCRQLDEFCHRLETISNQLSQSLNHINSGDASRKTVLDADSELQEAARLLQSMPERSGHTQAIGSYVSPEMVTRLGDGNDSAMQIGAGDDMDDYDSLEERESEDDALGVEDELPVPTNFGTLVADSYGRLRYLGGANNVLVEAAKAISPDTHTSPSASLPGATGTGHPSTASTNAHKDLELPIFVKGHRWPKMPYFPEPNELPRPRQYVSDNLINLYFDQLHHALPVLYKPKFMARYKQLLAGSVNAVNDKKFLSVFFAVCACASGLIPSEDQRADFPGMQYYQRSLVLHYATTGEASVERVQCLALLASCTAGWNTLTQSWTFAGQAVKAAQDLGMHLGGSMVGSDQPSNFIKQQMYRRIWWSVYCLDRLTSVCLGRPMSTGDTDCHCLLPLPLTDADLETHAASVSQAHPRTETSLVSSMTGFVAIAELCRIAGRIQRLNSIFQTRQYARASHQERFFRPLIQIESSLDRWQERLPQEFLPSAKHKQVGTNLTLSVVVSIVHAGSTLNLHRMRMQVGGSNAEDALVSCLNAARKCIASGELVHEVVPPSHLLAFCVHYITLSGLFLLRMPTEQREQSLPDVQKCIEVLKALETSWSGASKGRAIIEHLLRIGSTCENRQATTAPSFLEDYGVGWGQLPGTEFSGYDATGSDFYDIWQHMMDTDI